MVKQLSWIDVEMQETTDLMRKVLERLNDCDCHEIGHVELDKFHRIYQVLKDIKEIQGMQTIAEHHAEHHDGKFEN